jgi:hypothetical protein
MTTQERIEKARANVAEIVADLPKDLKQIALGSFDNGVKAAKESLGLTEREISYLYQTMLVDSAMREGDIAKGLQLSVAVLNNYGENFAPELATMLAKLKESLPEGFCHCCGEVHDDGEHSTDA